MLFILVKGWNYYSYYKKPVMGVISKSIFYKNDNKIIFNKLITFLWKCITTILDTDWKDVYIFKKKWKNNCSSSKYVKCTQVDQKV